MRNVEFEMMKRSFSNSKKRRKQGIDILKSKTVSKFYVLNKLKKQEILVYILIVL